VKARLTFSKLDLQAFTDHRRKASIERRNATQRARMAEKVKPLGQ
jgi:hypothetical protein